MSRSVVGSLFACLILSVCCKPALAQDVEGADEEHGLSWIMFPLFKGNDDAGFIYGAQTALVWEDPEAAPYLWESRLKLRLSTTGRHDHIWLFDAPDLLGSDFRITSRATFQRIDDANYFGVGNDTAFVESDRNRYGFTEFRAELYVRRELGRNLYLGAGAAFANTQVDAASNTLLAQESPRGIDGGIGAVTLLYAGYDSRDHDIVPTDGALTEVYLKQSNPGLGSTHGYVGLGINQQLYLSPLPWLVLAQRFMAEDLSGEVPFYELGRIGGSTNFPGLGGVFSQRGFVEQRFIGETKLLSNSEARAYFPPLWEKLVLGVGAFVDVSRVMDAGEVAFWRDLHPAVGAEFSVSWDKLFVFRVDYAVSEEGGLFYIEGRHIF